MMLLGLQYPAMARDVIQSVLQGEGGCLEAATATLDFYDREVRLLLTPWLSLKSPLPPFAAPTPHGRALLPSVLSWRGAEHSARHHAASCLSSSATRAKLLRMHLKIVIAMRCHCINLLGSQCGQVNRK